MVVFEVCTGNENKNSAVFVASSAAFTASATATSVEFLPIWSASACSPLGLTAGT
jgi:hypothetical protein